MSGQEGKPFAIPKQLVWQAWKSVKANGGAAGADGVTIEMFEKDLKNNLYKVWNRMSSGTYFPPPVRAVEIPKASGGTRILGVPTVGDRVAQTVAAMALEPRTEAIFHDDSYGYRPRKGALDAVGRCRERCWAKGLGDRPRHPEVLRLGAMGPDGQGGAGQRHARAALDRALRAAVAGRAHRDARRQDGRHGTREPRRVPRLSPVLANLFMHYAFDKWLEREFPAVEFERYADDAVVHCATERQASRKSSPRWSSGWPKSGCNCTRTRPGSCTARTGSAAARDCAETSFTFLGYTFRARNAPARQGTAHVHRVPARGQQGRPQANERGSPLLAHPPAHRHGTARPRRVDQSRRQRMDDLLRQVLQDRAEPPAAAHQHLPGALGTAEVQAATAIQEGPEMVEGPDRKAATPVRPLGLDDRVLIRLWMRRAE